MCGITGIFYFDSQRTVERQRLEMMTNIIRFRGPDSEGYFYDKNIGLGHRRLSIIDLETGNQPMSSDDNQITIVFNGEIYNYIELRNVLRRKGHKFHTTSDTEVIINAYKEWGVDCQNKFNGMWAFAIWDKAENTLFLSRDRIGEKPLHYAIFDNSLVFSSEIKSLIEYGIPNIKRYELLEIYFTLSYIPGRDTFYKNIYKLNPGHYIIAKSSGFNIHRYWDLPEIDEHEMNRNAEAIYDEFSNLLEDSVRIRMRSDVPYGAFLSGGLDSSSIVAIMSKCSTYPIQTFTIGNPRSSYDETQLANLVANKYNTLHNIGIISSDKMQNILSRLCFYFDEPFGDSSAIPTYHVSNYAAKKVKMVLTGDGGDEVTSGYNSYLSIKLSEVIKNIPSVFLQKISLIARYLAKGFDGVYKNKIRGLSKFLESSNLSFAEKIINKSSYVSPVLIKELTSSCGDCIKIEDYMSDVVGSIPYRDDFYKLMYFNFKFDLPDDYLTKVDRMSMANSIETRAPFLDYRLIEFMVKVDKDIKMQGWERKSVLRKTLGKQLPTKLLKAPKRGFEVPLRNWFNEGGVLTGEEFRKLRMICNPNIITHLLEEHKKSDDVNSNFIWMMLMLEQYI